MDKKKIHAEIRDKVYGRPEELEGRFNNVELEEIKEYFQERYPHFNEEEFYNALRGITMSGRGVYDHDVELALKCGIENRKPHHLYEWD